MASFEPWTLCEKGVEVVVLSVVWILALVWSLLTTSFDGPATYLIHMWWSVRIRDALSSRLIGRYRPPVEACSIPAQIKAPVDVFLFSFYPFRHFPGFSPSTLRYVVLLVSQVTPQIISLQ